MFWLCPMFIVISESVKANWPLSRSPWKLSRKKKNQIVPNKCDICTLDILVEVHWKNEANRWRSKICLIRSYVDSLKNWKTLMETILYDSLFLTDSSLRFSLSSRKKLHFWNRFLKPLLIFISVLFRKNGIYKNVLIHTKTHWCGRGGNFI